jgi:hypothetical protein
VKDLHSRQMGGDRFAVRLGAGGGLLLALRCRFEVDLGAENFIQLGDRFRLVKELASPGCNAELLAARPPVAKDRLVASPRVLQLNPRKYGLKTVTITRLTGEAPKHRVLRLR